MTLRPFKGVAGRRYSTPPFLLGMKVLSGILNYGVCVSVLVKLFDKNVVNNLAVFLARFSCDGARKSRVNPLFFSKIN